MISAGVEGRLPYMTYPEPWRGQPKQPPEFLRPAPKPVPPTRYNGSKHGNDLPTVFLPCSRYNGVNTTTAPNGTRLVSAQRPVSKYSSPPTLSAPVNLTQHKDEVTDELAYSPYRLYTPYTHFPPFTNIYPSNYAHMMRSTFPTTAPIPPLETYSPTTPTAISSSTFLPPPTTFSPPSTIKPGQSILRDKRTPPESAHQVQSQTTQQHVSFKVPSGKEGSLKHRILTRPEDTTRSICGSLDLQKSSTLDVPRKRLNATMSPPRSPKKPLNNNTVPGGFVKGSLIQLVNGELRKVEDMRTEDFVISAERSTDLRLADSTVVRIEENHTAGTAAITLTYNQRRTQVEIESTVEHPYFVFGQGWASCNPDRTQQCYGLKVHRLQVGDVLISLTPKEASTCPPPRSTTTIMTTATTTAMTVRQISVNSSTKTNTDDQIVSSQVQPINLHTSSHPPQSISPDSLAARKRRWSAPDQICDEDEQNLRKHRAE